jgi:hypothetical protein
VGSEALIAKDAQPSVTAGPFAMATEPATDALAEFKAAIIRDGIDAAASTHLMDRIPFVFNDDWELYRAWKRKLSTRIDVDPLNITIIGSAGMGFSLNPALRPQNWIVFG